MIERLKNAKRSKGMSVEVWGDVISNLCDSAHVTDPPMRYQYFLADLRNKEWKAALQSTIDESEFVGEATKKPTSEDSEMQQMMGLMQQTHNFMGWNASNTVGYAGSKFEQFQENAGGYGKQSVVRESTEFGVNEVYEGSHTANELNEEYERSYPANGVNAGYDQQHFSHDEYMPHVSNTMWDIFVSTTPEGPTTESVLQSLEANGLKIPFATDEMVNDAVAEAATTYVTGVATSVDEQHAVIVEGFDDAGTVPVEGPVGPEDCASLECNQEGTKIEVSKVDTESLAKLAPYPTNAVSGITVENVRSKYEGVPLSISADEVEFVNNVKHDASSDVGEPVAAELDTLNEDVVMIDAEQVANIVEGEPVPSVSKERLGEVGQGGLESCKVDGDKAPSRVIVFTHEELDMLENVSTIGAEEELEEYDKELEERLHFLDEVELKRRLNKNTERLQSLTLEEMSVLLKNPVETLRENREASPGGSSTPEYCLAWYKKRLPSRRKQGVPTVAFNGVNLTR
ncbi:hypothetical protein PHMEG_00019317 [Phytophthora megakarya]|uniref:Uncharacterized protein n=1 Tax=Phytophthora megakarya TaxID=4795 RepID=A0A225VS70_9STRA|nr:hypothetical protein PHMEG_00019317 [Phytophthora megakarya]